MPSSLGMVMSRMTTSGWCSAIMARHCSPSYAVPTTVTSGWEERYRSRISQSSTLLSAIKTRVSAPSSSTRRALPWRALVTPRVFHMMRHFSSCICLLSSSFFKEGKKEAVGLVPVGQEDDGTLFPRLHRSPGRLQKPLDLLPVHGHHLRVLGHQPADLL